MLPIELRLVYLGHCYIHLPAVFIQAEPKLTVGSIVSVRSVQSDLELFVQWNGRNSSSNSFAELDLTFAQANNLGDELVILRNADTGTRNIVTECHVEVLDANHYAIVSQHSETNLLDSDSLIKQGLVLPIFVSQHVHVLVKIRSFKPDDSGLGFLDESTELYIHGPVGSGDETSVETGVSQADYCKEEDIAGPIPYLNHCLALSNHGPMIYPGSMLVYGGRGSGKTYFLKTTLKNYSQFNGELINFQQLRGKRPEFMMNFYQDLLDESLKKQPTVLAFDDIDSIFSSDTQIDEELGQHAGHTTLLVKLFCNFLKQLERSRHTKGQRVAVMATCHDLEQLDAKISKPIGRKYFTQIVRLGFPNLAQRCTILNGMISERKRAQSRLTDDQILSIAKICNSFMPSDLKILVERSTMSAYSRSSLQFTSDEPTLTIEDFHESLNGYVPYNLRSVSLETKSARTFERVGGMKDIIEELRRTILLQVKYPKLFARSPIKPQNSILLYGPPGCGKTLVAEALTNEEGINSIHVRGPELMSKYIGASEAAVRDLFRRAELARPCVIFFDEFESLVGKRGSDSTGVTDRIVNQFLTLMDGVDRLKSGIFLLAASSRPDMIDPAILRPGRLDKHIYCPMPDAVDRCDILKVLTKNIEFACDDKDSTLASWSERLEGFTGADIEAFLYSAQLVVLHENPNCSEIVLKESHLEKAFEQMENTEMTRTTKNLNYHGRVASRATLA